MAVLRRGMQRLMVMLLDVAQEPLLGLLHELKGAWPVLVVRLATWQQEARVSVAVWRVPTRLDQRRKYLHVGPSTGADQGVSC